MSDVSFDKREFKTYPKIDRYRSDQNSISKGRHLHFCALRGQKPPKKYVHLKKLDPWACFPNYPPNWIFPPISPDMCTLSVRYLPTYRTDILGYRTDKSRILKISEFLWPFRVMFVIFPCAFRGVKGSKWQQHGSLLYTFVLENGKCLTLWHYAWHWLHCPFALSQS